MIYGSDLNGMTVTLFVNGGLDHLDICFFFFEGIS
jgi:hypothetical protein